MGQIQTCCPDKRPGGYHFSFLLVHGTNPLTHGSVFTARVSVQAVAGHAQVPKVLNAPEDLGAALAQSVAAQAQNVAGVDQNAAVADQNAAVADQNVAAQAQNVAEVDLIGAGDHDAVAVHNAVAFPHVAVAPGGKVVAHNYAQVDRDVARGSRFAQGVQVGRLARGDPFPPAAGFFPDVPAVRFARAAQYVPQGFRFPLPAVWWEQLKVVVLSVTNR